MQLKCTSIEEAVAQEVEQFFWNVGGKKQQEKVENDLQEEKSIC